MGFDPSQLEGEHLDQYALERFIAQGAMGLVYLALDTVLNRKVALKLISKKQDITSGMEEARKRLLKEAQAAARLSHNNIVTVHGYGETDDYQYIAMEYIAGKTLEEVFQERRVLPLQEVVPMALQVLDALDAATEENIVHRDIKPSNIMMADKSRVVVMDFGIARLGSGAGTATGAILGTPYYMSPEQVKGAKVDIRSDIFSLGAVLYQALTGVRPFEGSDVTTILYRIVHEEPAPPRELNCDLPGALQFIIQKALAKDPLKRYQTPAEMKEDILLFTREPLMDMNELVTTVVDQKHIRTQRIPTPEPPTSTTTATLSPTDESAAVAPDSDEIAGKMIEVEETEKAVPVAAPRIQKTVVIPWKAVIALGIVIVVASVGLYVSRMKSQSTGTESLPQVAGEPSASPQEIVSTPPEKPPAQEEPQNKSVDAGPGDPPSTPQPDSQKTEIATTPETPKQENPRDQTELGLRYLTGTGVPKDIQLALKAFAKAAELGDAEAQAVLGKLYLLGTEVTKDNQAALRWLKKAAEQKHAEAQYHLGFMYENGYAGDKNPKTAIQWYELAAEQGNSEAQNKLGLFYLNGVGVTRDYGKAIEWLKKAVDQENLNAATNLGYMYKNGYGAPQDYAEALRLYRKAAEGGNSEGQNSLGHSYLHGIGLPQDYKMALDWFNKAAEQGNSSSQVNLGFIYENGHGVPVDLNQAIKLYQKAAKQENSQGQYALGRCYFNGVGVTKDYPMALEWLTKAANQDHSQAQYLLGLMYENGHGVTISRAEALKWYKKSADKGNVNAQNKLKTLAVTNITP